MATSQGVVFREELIVIRQSHRELRPDMCVWVCGVVCVCGVCGVCVVCVWCVCGVCVCVVCVCGCAMIMQSSYFVFCSDAVNLVISSS